MNVGRKRLKPLEIVDADAMIDSAAIGNAMTSMQMVAKQEQQQTINEVLALGSDIGIVTLARINKGINAVAEIKAFERICESKAFKHLQIPGPGGVLRTADNIDEFCQLVFGKGYKAMNNYKVMLYQLGEETFEAATRIGLNRAQLRLLINLPEDTRTVVEEAMQASDKSEVVTLIQSLANQLDEAKEKTEELKAEVAAKEKVLEVRARQLDEAHEKLERVKALLPDQLLIELQKTATSKMLEVLCVVRGQFRESLQNIVEHQEEHGGDYEHFMSGLVRQIQKELTIVNDMYMLRGVGSEPMPEWLTDPRFNEFGQGSATPAQH